MTDLSHLNALRLRLSHEHARLATLTARWPHAKFDLHRVWIAQTEKEIASEEAFLGLDPIDAMSDDELLAALAGAEFQ